MSGFNIDAWHDFFAAQAAAGASLAGLVFVAISINLKNVLTSRAVAGRAIEALVLLLSLLIAGLLALIPDQGATPLGVEFIVLGLALMLVLMRLGAGTSRAGGATRGQYLIRLILGQLAMAPIVVAGLSLLAGDGGGLYWLAGAAITAIIAGMLGAWVLLVEILR